jgi:acetylornithine deacetylase/succinyl-diaminopimelate desuccinylase-like protein
VESGARCAAFAFESTSFVGTATREHDAQEIAHLCPVGRIFIPSRDGISHSPRDYSAPEDVTNGANMLLHSLLKPDAMKLD